MHPIRTTLFCGLLAFTLVSLALAQGKGKPKAASIDGAKLIGIWTMEEDRSIHAEFTKDGAHHVYTSDETETLFGGKGTYKLAGDQLSMTAELEGKMVTEVYQVKTLTDDVLVYQIPGEKTPTKFVRKKKSPPTK